MKDSIVIYKSFTDAIRKLPEEYQLEMWNAISDFSFTKNEPQFTNPINEGMWLLIRPQLDANAKRYRASIKNGKKGSEHGKKGGRPSKTETPKKPLDNPQGDFSKPLDNPQGDSEKPLNDNVNANENLNANEKENQNVNDNVPSGEKKQLTEDQIIYEIKNSERWLNEIAIMKKTTDARIRQLLNEFIWEMRIKGELDKDIKEVKKHFFNWASIQLAKPPPPPTPPKPPLHISKARLERIKAEQSKQDGG